MQTGINVVCMMNVVEHLDVSDLLELWSHIHAPESHRPERNTIRTWY